MLRIVALSLAATLVVAASVQAAPKTGKRALANNGPALTGLMSGETAGVLGIRLPAH